jgi:nicotinate-nucleotide pyrophosphorylase (carboxylating)
LNQRMVRRPGPKRTTVFRCLPHVVPWPKETAVDRFQAVQSRGGEDCGEAADFLDEVSQRPTPLEKMQALSKRRPVHRLGSRLPPQPLTPVQHHDVMAGCGGVKSGCKACKACTHHRHPCHGQWKGGWVKSSLERCFEVQTSIRSTMAEAPRLPHDRGHELWTMEDGASRKLMASIDRWVTALVGDDGIDMPLSSASEPIEAVVIARQDGLVVGGAVVDYLLQIWAPSVRITWLAGDGKRVASGDEIAVVSGDRDSVLAVERCMLNVLGQLSGIATEAKRWSAIAPRQIASTRKTLWGMLDKWAVHMGGGLTHRLSRDDATMVKENDLASMHTDLEHHEQRLAAFLQNVDMEQVGAFLEVEVRNEKEALVAAMIWAQRRANENVDRLVVMLDNMDPESCKSVSEQMEDQGVREHVVLEGSGSIVFSDLNAWRECGLDVVSTSAINRGVAPLDISMLVKGA